MLHFCGKRSIADLSRLLTWLYDELGPTIPSGDAELLK
jgi:hypothetical protein